MKGLGLHCTIQQGRPRVVGVLVERTAGDQLEGVQRFSHLSDAQEPLPLQLKNLASALDSQLPLIVPDAVVVRTMDYAASTKRKLVQAHGMVEGVLLAIARRQCERTVPLAGRDVGAALALSKAAAEAEATALVGNALKEAGAAALAALRLAENG